MKNLGKIFYILLIFPLSIYASVSASVDSQNVQVGEVVTYSLSLSGEDIQKPNIFSLCGEDIVSTGSSKNIQFINGDYKSTYVLSYSFIAKQSCTISSHEITIADKVEKTKPIEIKVQKFTPSKNDDFILSLSTNKDKVYVGEAFELVLTLKQKKSTKIVDNEFVQPSFKGFWVKGEPKQTRVEDGTYIVTTVSYSLAPQRVGSLEISPAQMKIASRKNKKNYWGGFFPEVKWRSYFSNALTIEAKALPLGVSLVGDFKIEAVVDKTEVNANEVVNLTIKVLGDGNLEDISSFKPYLDGVSVFDEKIIVKDKILSQRITFVADQSFMIPSFSLKTFNTVTNEIKVISTQAIQIKVKNEKVKEEVKITREVLKDTTNTTENGYSQLWLLITFVVGLILGILLMFLKSMQFSKSTKLDLKNHKMLLIKLMPYRDDEEVENILNTIESNLYRDTKLEVDKKVLKEIVKRYEIV